MLKPGLTDHKFQSIYVKILLLFHFVCNRDRKQVAKLQRKGICSALRQERPKRGHSFGKWRKKRYQNTENNSKPDFDCELMATR